MRYRWAIRYYRLVCKQLQGKRLQNMEGQVYSVEILRQRRAGAVGFAPAVRGIRMRYGRPSPVEVCSKCFLHRGMQLQFLWVLKLGFPMFRLALLGCPSGA